MTSHHHRGLTLAAASPCHAPFREIDHTAVQRAARELLRALGTDVDAEALQETPRRMADAYTELLTPQPFRATTFANEAGYDELIVARAIPFHSLCMHHLLPFHGVAHIGYLPGERIIGLSKRGRVVKLIARDLKIQERLTTQIARWLQRELEPKGGRGGPGGRAPVHVVARRAEARRQDGDLRAARLCARRRPHPPGVPGPDLEDIS
jgi:GTP cyclohydrolase I